MASIEQCIGTTEMEGQIEADERARLEAELATLRRKAAHWDEAYRLAGIEAARLIAARHSGAQLSPAHRALLGHIIGGGSATRR